MPVEETPVLEMVFFEDIAWDLFFREGGKCFRGCNFHVEADISIAISLLIWGAKCFGTGAPGCPIF
jgi:hypothetical protein